MCMHSRIVNVIRYDDDNWSRPSDMLTQSSQLLQRHWRHKRGSSHSQSPPTATSSLSTLLPEVMSHCIRVVECYDPL